MTGLIILLLIAAAIVYAVFFLIFKLVWMMIKKQGNKWPLIWAGVCTALFCAAVAGTVAWTAYKVVKPFTGIMERVQANPAPVYGETVYTDPEYGFELTVFNGMDFSDWMHFNGADVKLGIDTNLFKKDDAGKSLTDAALITAVVRIPNNSDNTSVAALAQALQENKDRRIEIHEIRPGSLNGQPSLYVSGTVYSNRGDSIPLYLMAAENGKHVYYVGAFETAGQPGLLAEQTVQSLHFGK